MKDSWIGKVAMGLVVLLVVWNIYQGVTVKEIGIPGFTFKFNTVPDGSDAGNSQGKTPPPPPPPEIEVDGRVVDFEKGVLISGAEVRLTIENATASQRTDSGGAFIFKVPQSASNAVATLDVTAAGFEPYGEHLSHVGSVQDVWLKHVLTGAPAGGLAGSGKGAAIGAQVALNAKVKPTQAQIQKLKAILPPYQRRVDAVKLIPPHH